MTFREDSHELVTSLPFAFLLLTALVSGCSSSTNMKVSRADLGDAWPFTVDSGVVACNHPSSEIVFFTSQSQKIYAIDEVAKGMEVAKGTKRYADVREILRDHPSVAGSKVDIGSSLDRGRKLC